MKTRHIVTISSGLGCMVAAVALWATATATSTAADDTARDAASSVPPSSALLTHDERPFGFDQLKGQTVLLNFIFTHCPSICPTQTRALKRVQDALPEMVRGRVHFVSVSIDPNRDTPEVLRSFATELGIDLAHWTFVTGPLDEVRAVSRTYSAQALPEGAAPLDHRTEIRLINAEGKLMQTYRGTPLDEARLVREIQAVDHLFHSKGSQ